MGAITKLGKPPGQEQALTTPYNAKERLAIIRMNVGQGYLKLAELCKCSYSTIYNDMRKWREQGGFEEFVYQEFFDLHAIARNEDPVATYRVLAGIVSKMQARKIEVGITHDIGPKFAKAMKETFGMSLDEPEPIEAEFDEIGEPITAAE